ncbi:NADH:flavin oxidoreductase [Blastococcus sp. BMG 814]|uniref:NADH:flavin oxidoreductase n=1 Tax=Blastococcus carthaginiensis TaxID=3050034 RepID=A0ABT9IIE5_9ACTN|nr:NADH:flavin oxidoreductase [Blastococcus carthaginiensis]MDP5185356.1 NADH:flavin oxidoreductase [Blastococcus carthaginiensis]
MSDLFAPLTLAHGPAAPNRLWLAPLTNTQSHPDGRLSDEELHWLAMRARGGHGLTMTCAAHVQAGGQGFPGQLGVFSDDHLPGLTRLATALKDAGSLAALQLHHAGARSPRELVGQPMAPSDDEESGARAMTADEVAQLVEDFAAAALRAERAGFDGVEVHGAHGYVLTQFLSPELNRRTDRYGGSLENRARLLLDVVTAVRRRCAPDFQVGVRLSPERFGLRLGEVREVAAELLRSDDVDYLDLSLWDVAKQPQEEAHRDRPLMEWFTDLDRGKARLGVAGKVRTGRQALETLERGADFVMVGRTAILHHDFPERVRRDAAFEPVPTPASPAHLAAEGLSPPFVDYMRGWRGFVADVS